MDKKFNTKKFLKSLKTNEFVLNCKMPMGYAYGIPVLKICNGYLCMTVPYLKYHVTGEVDKTLVYPIRNTITVSVPDAKIIAYEDLRFNPKFEKVNFSMPIGLFRPDKLKEFNQREFEALKTELYELYDKLIDALINGSAFDEADDERIGELLRLLVEPCLYPIYRSLDIDFYSKYLV